MKDLSLHILDIVQNSVHAGAEKIVISVTEKDNLLRIKISDNGKGINKEVISKVTDPFYSTGNKRTGLGLPLLKQKAEQCDGSLEIISGDGKGTIVEAGFRKDHIDLPPLGDMGKTLKLLIHSFPEKHLVYQHQVNDKIFILDTLEIIDILGGVDIKNSRILGFIEEMIIENLKEIGAVTSFK